ncbi:MAG: hypothetical protein M3308_03285, partial [Actinomycetota bacterium]|nr:hypothetical protein [Actinomycetota bacterium]
MAEVTDRLRVAPPVSAVPSWLNWAGWLPAVGIPTMLAALHMQLYGRWIVDDAAITFAYARSLASGEGAVLQPNADPVEGYSNPAWLAVLVLGRWLGLFDRGAWFGVPDLVVFPKIVALLCCAGIFAGFYAVARVVSRRPMLLTVVAGAATAAVPSFVIWVSSGLENPLLALVTVTVAAVLARAAVAGRLLEVQVAVGCGLLAALAALTRPDGLIYAAVYPFAVLLLPQPARVARAALAVVVSTVAFAVPASAYLAWRLSTFGEYLPNTALAKAQGLPTAEELNRPSELVAYTGWLTVVLVVGVIAAAMWLRGNGRTVLAMLLVPLGLAIAAFAVLEADWMGEYRFATPVWPLTALAASVAGAQVLPQLTLRARAAAAVLALVAAGLTGLGWASAAEMFRQAPMVPMCAVAQNIGATVNGFADILGVPDGTLATPDAGGSALTSQFEIIDIAGLTSAPIARFWRTGDMPGLRDYMFDDMRPAFIETHGVWSEHTGLVTDPRMTADYVPVYLTDDHSGWWVRRDLVPSQERLASAAEW